MDWAFSVCGSRTVTVFALLPDRTTLIEGLRVHEKVECPSSVMRRLSLVQLLLDAIKSYALLQ